MLTDEWLEFYREMEDEFGRGRKLERVSRCRVSAIKAQVASRAGETCFELQILVLDSDGDKVYQTWCLSSESVASSAKWQSAIEEARRSSATRMAPLRTSLREYSDGEGFATSEIIQVLDTILEFAADYSMLTSNPADVFSCYCSHKAGNLPQAQSAQEESEDELGRAFTLLREAVDSFVEDAVLQPRALAMSFVRRCCETGAASSAGAVFEKVLLLQDVPQESALFDIKPKFVSPSDWHAAVMALRELDTGADEWLLPSEAAAVVLNAINLIYTTCQAEHHHKDLGADDLVPILVYVVVKAAVARLPLFVTMMAELCPQDGQTGYYAITMFTVVRFIEYELDVSAMQASRLEPQQQLEEEAPQDATITIPPPPSPVSCSEQPQEQPKEASENPILTTPVKAAAQPESDNELCGHMEILGASLKGLYWVTVQGGAMHCSKVPAAGVLPAGDVLPETTFELTALKVIGSGEQIMLLSESGEATVLLPGSAELAQEWAQKLAKAAGGGSSGDQTTDKRLGGKMKLKGRKQKKADKDRQSVAAAQQEKNVVEQRLKRVVGEHAAKAGKDVFSFASEYLHCAFLGTECVWPTSSGGKGDSHVPGVRPHTYT